MKTFSGLFSAPPPAFVCRWQIFVTAILAMLLVACGGETDGGSASSSSAASSSSSSSSSSSGLSADACAAGSNIARGLSAATASSQDMTSAGLDSVKAFDGDPTTRWASAYSDSEWLAINLGAGARICGFRLSWEAAYGSAYQIQTSADGISWSTVHTVTNGDGAIDTIRGSAVILEKFAKYEIACCF